MLPGLASFESKALVLYLEIDWSLSRENRSRVQVRSLHQSTAFAKLAPVWYWGLVPGPGLEFWDSLARSHACLEPADCKYYRAISKGCQLIFILKGNISTQKPDTPGD